MCIVTFLRSVISVKLCKDLFVLCFLHWCQAANCMGSTVTSSSQMEKLLHFTLCCDCDTFNCSVVSLKSKVSKAALHKLMTKVRQSHNHFIAVTAVSSICVQLFIVQRVRLCRVVYLAYCQTQRHVTHMPLSDVLALFNPRERFVESLFCFNISGLLVLQETWMNAPKLLFCEAHNPPVVYEIRI